MAHIADSPSGSADAVCTHGYTQPRVTSHETWADIAVLVSPSRSKKELHLHGVFRKKSERFRRSPVIMGIFSVKTCNLCRGNRCAVDLPYECLNLCVCLARSNAVA
jgi:hypothetical protein